MSENASLSVVFSNSCEAAASGCEVSLELDEELNGGASSFEVGDHIYYRVYPSDVYSCFVSNGGTVSVICENKIATMTEEITFDGEVEASLSKPLSGNFSYTWLGDALQADPPHGRVKPNIQAREGSEVLTAKEAVYGIATVTYGYSYTSIKFSPINTGKQTLLVCRTCEDTGEEGCAAEVVEVEDAVFEDVTLEAVDACDSSLRVSGAQVVVDGVLIDSISGSDGKIHVGLLSKGTHSIILTAPGYVPSNEDGLSNDEIEVG
jgi:hypothetical protein